jgi:hypothetical protein
LPAGDHAVRAFSADLRKVDYQGSQHNAQKKHTNPQIPAYLAENKHVKKIFEKKAVSGHARKFALDKIGQTYI